MRRAATLLAIFSSACVARDGLTPIGAQRAVRLAAEARGWDYAPVRSVSIERAPANVIPEEYRARLDDLGLALQALGAPLGDGLGAAWDAALADVVGGYYDVASRTMFVASRRHRPGASLVLVHEATHALQHQRGTLCDDVGLPGLEDVVSAHQAIDEGAATVTSLLVLARLEGYGAPLTPALFGRAGARFGAIMQADTQPSEPAATGAGPQPDPLEDALAFPYNAGTSAFVRLTQQPDALAAWDALEREPPLSTEQLLHPGADAPTAVDVAPLLAGWQAAPPTVLGERWFAFALGSEVAAGWGGDVARIYRRDGATMVVLASTWDSERDADEAEAALRRLPLVIARDGRRMVAVSPATASDVATSALAHWREQRFTSRAVADAFWR